LAIAEYIYVAGSSFLFDFDWVEVDLGTNSMYLLEM